MVSVHTPALGSGRGLRTYAVARALAAGGEGLTLVYTRFGATEPAPAFAQVAGLELHEVVPSRGVRRGLSYARARAAGVPDGFARGVTSDLADAVGRLRRSHRGRVIADGPTEAATLSGLSGSAAVIYNAHNLESGFRHELRDDALRAGRTLRRFERRVLARAAESWMVTEPDAEAARRLCPTARIRVVPNAVDTEQISPVTPSPRAARLVFVGDFSYEPNRDALAFLVGEILPRVRRQVPAATLRVVGRGIPPHLAQAPGVQALGFVSDIATAYADVSCAVVPLRQGGGSPLKLIEALAHGLPVVASSRAGAALALRSGVDALIADGPDAFAEAVLSTFTSAQVAAGLGRAGRELARRCYSIEALTELLRPARVRPPC